MNLGISGSMWRRASLLLAAVTLGFGVAELRALESLQADTTLTIARLQYDGGGDWYANPSSLPNVLAAVRERTGIPVATREVVVRPTDSQIRNYPFLYMTGHGNVKFSIEERAALRAYLTEGGFLHADDNYGLDESFREEIAAIFPDRELVELPRDHPVFHAVYDFPEGLPKIHEHDGEAPQAFGIFHRGRLVVFYSYESDLGDGWEDEDVHNDPLETREQALRMGVNLFVHVLAQSVR
jgi:hypothetical protein